MPSTTTAPDYYVGLVGEHSSAQPGGEVRPVPFGAGARQAELRLQQLKKQIRIEVRNAQYALEQSEARVVAARKGRELAQKTFDITTKEQAAGGGIESADADVAAGLGDGGIGAGHGDDRVSEGEDRAGARGGVNA